MRWDPGFLCGGDEFEGFWAALAAEIRPRRRALFIGGRGFDPRTTAGPRVIARTGFQIEKISLIRLTNSLESPDRPPNQDAIANESIIRNLYPRSKFRVHEIPVRNSEGRFTGSASVRNLVAGWDHLREFTDVIVDITALPSSVSFPLIACLISTADERQNNGEKPFNLHCIVCENAKLDEMIIVEGGDVAEYIDPFRGRGGLMGESDPITIWAPVLGERQSNSLRKIYDMLGPQEVKPFLPSPSLNPRRADELVSEYHSVLFDTWEVDPQSFIYADERDPFDIYRQLCELAEDYTLSLSLLGTTDMVVSAHSSKLLSLGALLSAFERGLAIAHVEPTGYSLDGSTIDQDANELFEVWLTGEAYA